MPDVFSLDSLVEVFFDDDSVDFGFATKTFLLKSVLSVSPLSLYVCTLLSTTSTSNYTIQMIREQMHSEFILVVVLKAI